MPPCMCHARLPPALPCSLPRSNLLDTYYLGRVIGAGSFGVVREGIEVASGRRLAVKTVSKVPKRGAPTPRCVLACVLGVC